MKDELDLVSSVLKDAGYTSFQVASTSLLCVAFENDVSFGFVHCFEKTEDLLENWKAEKEQVLSKFQFQLRSAGQKAWNAYSVFLAFGRSTNDQIALMARIEEDLSGTRKIARSIERTLDGVRSGLLPLLLIQNPPILGPVDMVEEIRARSAGLPKKSVEAFLVGAPNTEILRLMGRSDET